jgi:hypothetical protein
LESETGAERLKWQSGKVVKSGEECRLCEGFWNLRLMRRVWRVWRVKRGVGESWKARESLVDGWRLCEGFWNLWWEVESEVQRVKYRE